MGVLLLRMFHPAVGNSECSFALSESLLLGKTRDIWHPEPNFAEHQDRAVEKPVKPTLFRENRDK